LRHLHPLLAEGTGCWCHLLSFLFYIGHLRHKDSVPDGTDDLGLLVLTTDGVLSPVKVFDGTWVPLMISSAGVALVGVVPVMAEKLSYMCEGAEVAEAKLGVSLESGCGLVPDWMADAASWVEALLMLLVRKNGNTFKLLCL